MISQLGFLTERTVTAVVLSIVCLAVFLVISAYLLAETKKPGWYDRFGNKLAVPVGLVMFGETLSRGWGAVLTVMFSRGMDIGPIEDRYPLAFAGSVIMLMGMLCMLRILTPEKIGNVRTGEWGWISVGIVAIAIAIAIVVL